MRFFSREHTRFSRRNRLNDQRGFVLGAALLIAVLYFALMELLLIDSTRSLQEAERFRSHIVAATLAESAAELAAAGMVTGSSREVHSTDSQGKVIGTYARNGAGFELTGEATTGGVPVAAAHVHLQGRFVAREPGLPADQVTIDYSTHSQ